MHRGNSATSQRGLAHGHIVVAPGSVDPKAFIRHLILGWTTREVVASRSILAERVGFEPTKSLHP